MKSLATTFILILGICTLSHNSNAAGLECDPTSKSYSVNNHQSPWHTFKEVVNTYQTASGKFQNLSPEEQEEFFMAAEVMKNQLARHQSYLVAERLKKIDLAVNIFKFIWDNKSAPVEIDMSIETPTFPILS